MYELGSASEEGPSWRTESAKKGGRFYPVQEAGLVSGTYVCLLLTRGEKAVAD
jgi:hypothetical protein